MKFLLKLLNSLLRIVLLSIITFLIVIWFSLAPEKRAELVNKLDEITPFDIAQNRDRLRSTLRDKIAESDNQFIKEGASFLSESLGNDYGLIHILDINCGLPQNQAKAEQSSGKIYQWKDANGKLHFGDNPESEAALDLSDQYKSKESYITSEVILNNAKLPLDGENNLRTSVNKAFLILSDSVDIEQMHQLELKMHIFGTQSGFEAYKKQKAPRLQFAAGFYLPDENIASILMQPSEQQTLSLIMHESTHVMMANLFGLTPLWLNEGFSQYFQNIKIAGFENTIYPDRRSMLLLKSMGTDSNYTINKHLRLKDSEWQGENIYQHYAEAWSLVYFLMSSTQGKAFLKEYLVALREDRCDIPDTLNFFSDHYPGGLSKLDTDWNTWLKQDEIHPHRY